MKEKLIQYIQNNNYDEQKKYQLISSYNTLKAIDEITNYFKENPKEQKDALLMHTYGLLQGLFVGVDALYTLTYGITDNKYDININQNKALHELKFIRNDVVGHPTNRMYGNRGVGYSTIDIDNLKTNQLTYKTHLFFGDEYKFKEKTIKFDDLITAYNEEKDLIINRLYSYANKKYIDVRLSFELRDLYLDITKEKLDYVEKEFIKYYGNLTNHRFIWRLNLLKLANELKSDEELIEELLRYSEKYQAIKLYEISIRMEKRNKRLPKIALPKILASFFRYIKRNQELQVYIRHLHDVKHPFFQSDLNYLIKEVKNKDSLILLNYLNSLKNSDEIYLIGSIIKSYDPKK